MHEWTERMEPKLQNLEMAASGSELVHPRAWGFINHMVQPF